MIAMVMLLALGCTGEEDTCCWALHGPELGMRLAEEAVLVGADTNALARL